MLDHMLFDRKKWRSLTDENGNFNASFLPTSGYLPSGSVLIDDNGAVNPGKSVQSINFQIVGYDRRINAFITNKFETQDTYSLGAGNETYGFYYRVLVSQARNLKWWGKPPIIRLCQAFRAITRKVVVL